MTAFGFSSCEKINSRPVEPCPAVCPQEVMKQTIVAAKQKWFISSSCASDHSMSTQSALRKEESYAYRDCQVHCDGPGIIKGNSSDCYTGPWGKCRDSCEQGRTVGVYDAGLGSHTTAGTAAVVVASCRKSVDQRACYFDDCVRSKKYEVLVFDVVVNRIHVGQWSYSNSEDFEHTLSSIFELNNSHMKIQIDKDSTQVKNQIKAKLKIYLSPADLKNKSLQIKNTNILESVSFKTKICANLYRLDKYSDWRWLQPEDIHITYSTYEEASSNFKNSSVFSLHSLQNNSYYDPFLKSGIQIISFGKSNQVLFQNILVVLVFLCVCLGVLFRWGFKGKYFNRFTNYKPLPSSVRLKRAYQSRK